MVFTNDDQRTDKCVSQAVVGSDVWAVLSGAWRGKRAQGWCSEEAVSAHWLRGSDSLVSKASDDKWTEWTDNPRNV